MPSSTDKEKLHLSDFTISESNSVLHCPFGKSPVGRKTSKKANLVYFSIEDCTGCPDRSQCPAKNGKKRFTLRYTEKDIRLAKQRQKEKSAEFVS